MSEVSKAEKIAAARKKLKQFQLKNKDDSKVPSSTIKSVDLLNKANNSEDISSLEKPTVLSSAPIPFDSCNDFIDQPQITSFFNSPTIESSSNGNLFDDLSQQFSSKNQIITQSSEQISGKDMIKSEALNSKDSLIDREFIYYNQTNTGAHQNNDSKAELESVVAYEKNVNAELQNKLIDSHNHVLSLQYEIKRLNDNQSLMINDKITELEDTIKVHLQTIGILVSEKTELQKELLHLQDIHNANNSKCEELASRLKASRSQVQKLEKELLSGSEDKSHQNAYVKNLEKEVEQKGSTIEQLSQKMIDSQNEIKELNKKLEIELTNHIRVKKELEEMHKQLSMAQIKLTQLGNGNEADIFKELEALKSDLTTAKNEAERAWDEKSKCETELKQYIVHLNSQVLQANEKCNKAESEKDDVSLRVENLVVHISTLEKQLQQEKNLRESVNENDQMKNFKESYQELEDLIKIKDEQLQNVYQELDLLREKLNEAEIWKENVPDMGLLQQAMESDRVAAARAIEQNNNLKQKLQDLEEYIIKINNSKLELTEELDKYKHMAGEFRLQLEKYKSRQEMRMVDSVTQTSPVKKSDSVTQTSYDDLTTNIDSHEPVSLETVIMIEEKLKRTMDQIAELSEEKHNLEHLVLQLQSETETIGEYVALYQNQRSILKEKAEERERQLVLVSKEREELKVKLDEINLLLTQFPHNPDLKDTTCKISTLLCEIQSSSIVQDQIGPPPTFHPCLLCSGKLITV